MKRALLGFVAGFISTLTFHQLTLWVLHALAVAPRGPYAMNPVPPFGVPAVISLAFWGGIWGILLAYLVHGMFGAKLWIYATLFGAIAPSAVALFVVFPLKGLPLAGGWTPKVIGPVLLLNGAWGLGVVVLMRWIAALAR